LSMAVRPKFDEAVFNSPNIPKTLVIHVTVAKSVAHWGGGFGKTIHRRMHRVPDFNHDEHVRQKAKQAKIKFSKQFRTHFGRKVPAGSIIKITWYEGVVTTEMDGTVTSRIENDTLGRALFMAYYGSDCVNPQSKKRARLHYEHGMTSTEESEQDRLKNDQKACPQYRKCGHGLSFW